MAFVSRATITQTPDMIDRMQQCQDPLMEMEELDKQKEELINLMVECEGKVEERRSRILGTHKAGQTATIEKTFESMQAKLVEHKQHVLGLLHNLKNLQSAYCELILRLLRKDADPSWIRIRRKRLSTALHLAKDIHLLITQNSGNIIRPRKQKRSFWRYRRRRQSRKR